MKVAKNLSEKIQTEDIVHGTIGNYQMLDEILEDSGWLQPSLNSGWTSQYQGAPVRYRKINGIVYVEAFVSATTEASNVIFTLPTGFRPTSQYKRFPVYTSDRGQQWCQILSSGTVEYLFKSSSVQWFCINISFPTN